MEEPRKSSWPFWTTLVLVFVFVIYPLSIGPVAFVCNRLQEAGWPMDRIDPALRVIYFPILFAVTNSSTAESVFNAYMRLWIDM